MREKELSKVELFERIRHDHRKEGWSIRTLARHHEVHRRTVRQALASARPPTRRSSPRAAPALGPWKPTIEGWLRADLEAPRKQRHTARRVWQRLLDEHGALVGESTVRAYVSEVRRDLVSGVGEVTIVALHGPGEEAEVDFGAATVILAGRPTLVHIFHLRLSHSGKAVHLPFLVEDQLAFLEGFAVTFERLGGVPERVSASNMFPATYSMTVRRGTPSKKVKAATCAALQASASSRSTGRTNMYRDQARTMTKAHTRRMRPACGSSQRPR